VVKSKRTAAQLEELLLQHLCAEPEILFAGVAVTPIASPSPGRPNWKPHIIGLHASATARAKVIARALCAAYDLA
jgi:hypothetical protein